MLKSMDTPSAGINASNTIVFQYLIPAGMWQSKDRLRLFLTLSKSGTTNGSTGAFYIGTAGTTSDTLISSGASIASANRATAVVTDFRLEDATHVLQLANNAGTAGTLGYSATSANASTGEVAVTDASANPLYFSAAIAGGATDTVQMIDAQLYYCAAGG
jgi:hypothetical protein